MHQEEVAKIKLNLPSIMTLHNWKNNPEALRGADVRKEDNRLLALLGRKPQFDGRRSKRVLETLGLRPRRHRYLMMWPAGLIPLVSQFSSKQAGLDFVMEGIVHDVVFFVTGFQTHVQSFALTWTRTAKKSKNYDGGTTVKKWNNSSLNPIKDPLYLVAIWTTWN